MCVYGCVYTYIYIYVCIYIYIYIYRFNPRLSRWKNLFDSAAKVFATAAGARVPRSSPAEAGSKSEGKRTFVLSKRKLFVQVSPSVEKVGYAANLNPLTELIADQPGASPTASSVRHNDGELSGMMHDNLEMKSEALRCVASFARCIELYVRVLSSGDDSTHRLSFLICRRSPSRWTR